MSHPLEARLRGAHELFAATVSVSAAVGVLAAPGLFLLDGAWSGVLATALLGHSAWRGRQGLRVLEYRRNLRRLRSFEMESAEIPWSAKHLYLGRGFRWDQRHTQRLFEARQPANQTLLEPRWWDRCLSVFERFADAPLGLGGDPALHGVEPDEGDLWMDLSERVGHTLVLGTTRVGKTRLAELLITQDIRRGEVVIVFDPKGDIDLLRRIYAEAERAGRSGEFFMFHLGHPEISARYNPVGSFSRITEVATRIAGQLPSEGQSAAFKEFVWRFVNVMARALVALGRKPDYQEINRYASDIEPLLVDYFEQWLDREPAAAGWREALQAMAIDKKSLDKGLQSRGARAVSAVTGALWHALNPRPLVEVWRMNRDRVLLVGAVLAVLLFGVLHGILAAIGLSLVAAIRRFGLPVVHELGRLGASRNYVVLEAHADASRIPGLLILRPEAPLFFANAERVVTEVVRRLNDHREKPIRVVILSLEESVDLDSTALECLVELAGRLRKMGIVLVLSRAKDAVRELLSRWDPHGAGDPSRMYFSVDDAVCAQRTLRESADQ